MFHLPEVFSSNFNPDVTAIIDLGKGNVKCSHKSCVLYIRPCQNEETLTLYLLV